MNKICLFTETEIKGIGHDFKKNMIPSISQNCKYFCLNLYIYRRSFKSYGVLS